jgi:hypothetical protein
MDEQTSITVADDQTLIPARNPIKKLNYIVSNYLEKRPRLKYAWEEAW